MLYREVGQFKASYAADQAIFPLREDRIGMIVVLLAGFVVIPLASNDYWLRTLLTPFLIYALAAIGLNLLTGYAGQVSLGTGAFMGVGAYAAYNISIWLPSLNIIFVLVMAGLFASGVGILFGLPSLRIKGFYLAVATLAAQFFLDWCFVRVPWLVNYNVSGAIEVASRTLFGIPITGPNATASTRYLVVLAIVGAVTWLGSNLVHGRIGRMWMAVRDMDIAAELIGIRLYRTKLLAFAVSSFYAGVAGAMLVFLWLGASEADSFDINASFLVLFMVIIGGLGSLLGSSLGSVLILGLPIVLRTLPGKLGVPVNSATVEHLQFMIVGALIIFFLIVEPNGLARLWQIGKQKLRVWPFPY